MACPKTVLVWSGAAALLVAMLWLMLDSSRDDSLTSDETAHIAAGYAYLRFRDARLNPEHPPLLKMLAAAPLLLRPLEFPLNSTAWREALNGQWEVANLFLYASGNDPHWMAAQARLMPIVLTVGLGLALFLWTKRRAGATAALLTLALYASSPTVLAHGRLVTTDVSGALGVALAGFAFAHFLTNPGYTAALLAGLALGLALLGKFSTLPLVPLFVVLTLLWMYLEPRQRGRYLRGLGLIGCSAALLVLLPYLWITADYPPERQLWDTYWTFFRVDGGPAGRLNHTTAEEDFARLREDRTRDLRACLGMTSERPRPRLTRCPVELAIFLADKPVLRGWGQSLTGVGWMQHQARTGGAAALPFYFLGEVSSSGWRSYFPLVYAIKEPLAFHLMTVLALGLALARVRSGPWQLQGVAPWLRRHAAESLMLAWVILYWVAAIHANLNLGVRHLLPVFPFTIILVASEISRWLTRSDGTCRGDWRVMARRVAVVLLLLWQVIGVLSVYPSFLAYFNEAVGGPEEGGHYVVDSNLDWGQDLRRLRAFLDAREIDTIALDYFGTSSPDYELGGRYLPWRSAKGLYPGWLAVSATHLKIAQGRWDPALGQAAEDAYEWLRGKDPVAKIGYSIFVFDLRHEQIDP